MSAEENKAKVLRLLDEVFSKRNTEAFRQVTAPDVVFHMAGYPEPFRGAEAVHQWATRYLLAFDDVQLTVEKAVAEGDTVAVRWRIEETHRGDYADIPATGRRLTFTALDMIRFREGKVQEIWMLFDTVDVMKQLGFFPRGRPPRALLSLILRLQRLWRRPS